MTLGIRLPDQVIADNHDDEREMFLSSMGHELRNPLASIIAHAETLQEGVYGPLQDAQKTALASIQKDVRQMLHLVADVIDLSRDDSPPLHPIACPLDETCQRALERVMELANSRSATITCEIHPPHLSVMADAQKLRQLITELLSAALLTLSTGCLLRLEVRTDDGQLYLHTHSSPSELPSPPAAETAACQSPLLQRLKKLKPIGIALLQKLVWLHKGTYTISEPDAHTVRMFIRLPLEVLPASEQVPETPLPEAGSHPTVAPPQHPKSILLADDQPTLIAVTRNYLESLGFQVITARDGREAVHLACTARPDLILMDVRMPVVDGLSAIRQIRESTDPQIRTVPIISLSGLSSIADKEKCLAAGATAYLSKPFGVREIDRIITDFLQRSHM